jgi:hypothetical protein
MSNQDGEKNKRLSETVRELDFYNAAEHMDALVAPHSIETNGLTWMAAHGMLCLALRDPAMTGPSRELVVNFVQALGEQLVAWRVLTLAQLREAQRVEQEESPHDRRVRRCQERNPECGQCELKLGHEGHHLAGYVWWQVST